MGKYPSIRLPYKRKERQEADEMDDGSMNNGEEKSYLASFIHGDESLLWMFCRVCCFVLTSKKDWRCS